MRYKTKKGIVLTSVCGQHILVAAKKAREEGCPYITQINDTAAGCWHLLEDGSTEDELTSYLIEEYEIADAAPVRDDVMKLLENLSETGYLTASEEG